MPVAHAGALFSGAFSPTIHILPTQMIQFRLRFASLCQPAHAAIFHSRLAPYQAISTTIHKTDNTCGTNFAGKTTR